MRFALAYPLAAASLLLAACSSYVTPGRPADLRLLTEPGVKQALAARPALTLPANLVLARIQESGYRNYAIDGYGGGIFSLITAREVESEDDLRRIQALPGIEEAGMLSRLLVPRRLDSERPLREAAARLHADLLLVYTFDTVFRDRDVLPPLSVITLGLSPTQTFTVTSTASAVVFDVKTGYVYGVLEESRQRSGIATAWNSSDAMERARKKAELDAYKQLISSFEPFWTRLYERYSRHKR